MIRACLIVLLVLAAGCSSASKAEKLDARGQKEKSVDRSVDFFSQAIELAPDRADFWLHRGDARVKQCDYHGAIADYTESLRLVPNARTHLHRSRARRAKRMFDLALADVNAALELDPEVAAAAEKERVRIRSAMGDKSAKFEDGD